MQNCLTNLEKHLFNKHLAVSRKERNKPFKLRSNFTGIENTDKYKFLKRISTLFIKHPEIDPDLFFKAPYRLYKDVEYFGLDYFSSMRAVKAYTTYKKTLFLQDPDEQLEQIKESLVFITKFCIENKIHLHLYPYHRNSDVFVWMQHYKQNKINLYCLFEFQDIFSSVNTLSEDVQKFYVSNFVEQFKELHANYKNSTIVKPYLKKTIPVLNNFISKKLTPQ